MARRKMILVLVPCLVVVLAGLRPVGRAGSAAAPAPTFLPLVVRAAEGCPATGAAPLSDGQPSWSTPIAVSPLDGTVWTVNPDAGSVSQLDPRVLAKRAELVLGGEPWSLAFAPDGQRLYVVDRAGGQMVVVDTARQRVCARLDVGPEAAGVALSPGGREAYVTASAAGAVVVIDLAALRVRDQIAVAAHPYAIAVSDDGDGDDGDETVYVTHFLSRPRPGGEESRDDGREGLVTVLAGNGPAISQTITLAPDKNGFPSLLAGIALFDKRAWIPHVRAAPDLPMGLTTTVFAAVAALDLEQMQEDEAGRLLLNDEEIFGSPVNNPLAAVPSADGRRLYVVLAGSDLVEVIDVADPRRPRLEAFLAVGRNPRGMALSADGRQGYVLNYLSRSISVLDLESLSVVGDVPVTAETLPAAVLQGKVLFNNAVDPRLSKGGWVSCASCHPDGGTDGVTWIFPDGPRQTPPLWNALQTLPWHWSAALDEAQDVETTVEGIQHGLGLAPGEDPPLLGPSFAGRSADLDALADYLASGIRLPQLPPAPAAAERGRQVFIDAGCAGCHGGPAWTNSALPGPAGTLDEDGDGMVNAVLAEVGTLNPRDVRGAAGFDVPSLLNAGLTAPYFHDGSQASLRAVVESGHPSPGAPSRLDEEQVAALAAFLQSIGPLTVPVDSR